MSNIYLHEVLDQWFDSEVKPRLRGRAFMVRFADDALLAFAREDDARRVLEVLPKRFERFGLALHPAKTRLVDFRSPSRTGGPSGSQRERSFDLLGFTHHTGGAPGRGAGWYNARRPRPASVALCGRSGIGAAVTATCRWRSSSGHWAASGRLARQSANGKQRSDWAMPVAKTSRVGPADRLGVRGNANFVNRRLLARTQWSVGTGPTCGRDGREQIPQQIQGRRRATGDSHVHGGHILHRPAASVGDTELAPGAGAGAGRDDELRRGRGGPGAAQCLLHLPRDRSRHQRRVGVSGRCHEMHAEPLHAVIWHS